MQCNGRLKAKCVYIWNKKLIRRCIYCICYNYCSYVAWVTSCYINLFVLALCTGNDKAVAYKKTGEQDATHMKSFGDQAAKCIKNMSN